MRMRTVMEEHYTGCQQSTIVSGPKQFTSVSKYICDVDKFYHQLSCPVPENSYHQLSVRQFCFKLFSLFGEGMRIDCFL
jgi:hypothetical protein